MIMKLALWYLKKCNITVLLNCKFDKPVTIRAKDNIYHEHCDYVEGTSFLYENGNRMVLGNAEELDK